MTGLIENGDQVTVFYLTNNNYGRPSATEAPTGATKEERWDAAKTGMANSVLDTLEFLANAALRPPLRLDLPRFANPAESATGFKE